jgi:PAS domain S-box-containing protein
MDTKPTYEELEQKVKELENIATERKRAEEALKKSEQKYRDLFESNKDGIVLTDMQGKILDANEAYLDMLGYEMDEMRKVTYQQLTPEKWHKWEAGIVKNQFIKRGYSDEFEKEYIKKDGTVFPVSIKGWLVKDEQGQPIGMWGFVRDISERKQAEERLHEIKELDEKILYGSPLAFVLHDRELRIVRLSHAYEQVTGYEPDEVLGKRLQDFVPEGPPKRRVIEGLKKVRDEGVQVGPRDILAPTREETYLTETILPIFDPMGRVSHILSVLENITKRKRTEEALTQSEEQYRTLVETVPHGIQEIDCSGAITFANLAHNKMYGYGEEEMLGKSILDLQVSDSVRKDLASYLATLVKEQPEPTPYIGKNFTRDGTVIDVQVDWNYRRDKQGRVVGFISVLTNITQRKQAEQALKEKEVELEIKAKNLEEVNTALRVLLKRREGDKAEVEEKVLSNVKDLVLPYLERLQKTSLDANQISCVSILESNLNDIVSPFSRRLSSKYLGLTPTEIRVANLVKDGKTTKEIAEFMNLSNKTIQTHRDNVRKKTGIKHKKTNLRTYLLSLQ